MAQDLNDAGEGKKNFPTKDAIEAVMAEIFAEQDALDKKAAAYKDDTAENRANISAIIKNAKNDHGIPTATARFLLAEEKARRAIEAKKKGLKTDDHDYLLAMKDALGEYADTPLGQAAVGGDVKTGEDE